jgi:hypothetical protein
MHEKHSKIEEVEGSHFFYLSDGASRGVYEKMRRNGVSDDSLKEFVLMEDQLLGLEQKAVCSGIPYSLQGNVFQKKSRKLSQTITSTTTRYTLNNSQNPERLSTEEFTVQHLEKVP